ncbi:RidA family protein [Nitratireductor sp. ZSWI3]|nr:RidA family protein [Nitratireductor sp. ZSWI3]
MARNPSDGIYAAMPDYVHALEVQGPSRWLYIAGTMGLDEAGVAPATLEEQLDLIWRNLNRILVEADMTTDNIVRITSYLTDPAFAEANGAAREKALGTHRVPTTAIVTQTLDPTWLVEIEAIAAA